ncbi:6920_t:CDS:1, partial [Gigaspora margarita]
MSNCTTKSVATFLLKNIEPIIAALVKFYRTKVLLLQKSNKSD